MSSEDISLQNGLNSQLVFQDENLRFNCPPTHRCLPDPSPKTRQLAGFIDDKLFTSDRFFPSQFPRNLYPHDRPDQPHHTNWNPNATDANDSGSDSDSDDDDQVVDDDDVDGDQDNGVDALVAVDDNSNSNNNNNNTNSSKSNTISNTDNNTTTTTSTNPPTVSLVKFGNGNGKANHHSSFESSLKVMVVKDGGTSMGHTSNNASDTVAEADGEMYYSQYLQATEGSGSGGKDMGINNGCGFSGRKELSACSAESGESLRAILSDPVTGALMDDAMILPCGHSFGGGGIQHVIRMKACYTCSQSIVEDAISPNLSLRTAVQAFQREEELLFYRSAKRKRDRFDQEKGSYGDSTIIDQPRGKGVQFPFAVTDRVIIKGNKRTPERFVGREAVVTTQCLNGWYVVKTLDNAESVKLQYRSLAKVSDDPSSKAIPNKFGPHWL